MRGSLPWICLVAVLPCAACTAPPEYAEFPAAASLEIEPPVFEYVHLSDAPPEPEPPPGCPPLRVFTDAEDLCRRGIMPLMPLGGCHRMRQTNEGEPDGFVSSVQADRVEVPALRGHAELFVRHYLRSDDRDLIYLALRSSNGYVLLTRVGEYFSQSNNPPEFEHFVGNAASVEVTTLQQWWEPGEQLVRETTRCTLDADGGLRCDGKCPTLALAGSPPPLDCAALASFDWSTLSHGRDALDEWGGWDAEFQQGVAEDYADVESDDYSPTAVRRIEVGDRTLTMLEPVPGQWVLLHEHVPLLASRRPIRVGPAPGGVYASSWSDGAQRVHRLLLDTHEIEPVLPGACG
jgi:hypothetical protein